MEASQDHQTGWTATSWDGKPAPFPRPLKLRAAYLLYQIAIHLLIPVLLVRLFRLARREPLYRKHISHRLGFGSASQKGPLWIFAASLGETRAASPLIRKLLEQGETLLLTHSSAAGLKAGQDLFSDEIAQGHIIQRYQPIDALLPLWLFLWRYRPVAGLVVECELWPGLMFEPRRFSIPMIAINGSYTERAQARDKDRFWGLRLALWCGFSRVTTKSRAHAERYETAGIRSEHIATPGELKFDLPLNALLKTAGQKARRDYDSLSKGRGVVMFASSIEGEEAQLFDVISRLHETCSLPPLVLWVPRSPQRFDAVAQASQKHGLRTARRSKDFSGLSPKLDVDCDVLVGDSIGEMDFYYAFADVVFVGATLFPMGGHNPIEPLAHEKPVVTGPSIYGVAFPAFQARDRGALRVFEDGEALAVGLSTLFQSSEELAAFADQAKGFNAHHKGASARTVELLAPVLKRRSTPGAEQ